MSRITLRCSDGLKESFREHADAEGKSMSEALKEYMREATGHTSAGKLPDEPELADAYRALYYAADGNAVEIDDAESTVADATNTRKSAVRSRLIKPLKARGYITLQSRIAAVYYRPNVDLIDDVSIDDPAAEEEATA